MPSPWSLEKITTVFSHRLFLFDGIDNLTDFTVYFLYQAVVRIAVHTPVFGSKGSGGVYVEVVGSFVFNDIGVVRILGEVGRKSRTVTYLRCTDIAVGQVLTACIFANIVRVVERSYQEKRLVVFPGKELYAGFCQSVIAMLVQLVKAALFVGDVQFGYVPFAAVCTLISGILDKRAQRLCLKRVG